MSSCKFGIDRKKSLWMIIFCNYEQTIIIKSFLKFAIKLVGLMRSWLSYVDFITRADLTIFKVVFVSTDVEC